MASMPQQNEHNYFSGLEITNIFLIEPPRKRVGNMRSSFDGEYRPVDYLSYVKTNFDRIVLDRSFDRQGGEFNVFKTGKLRTGLACRRFKSGGNKDFNMRVNCKSN